MIAEALLLWLVAYAGLFAAAGFLLFIIRGLAGRQWSNRALLRTSSGIAFMLSVIFWLLVMLAG